MNIICFGDSNTYGYDPRTGGRYTPENRWTDILAEKTGWSVCNMGKNGRTVPPVPPDFPPGTDFLILMLGTNDLLQGRTPAETAGLMKQFLLGLCQDPEKILLTASPPLVPGGWVRDPALTAASVSLARYYQVVASQLAIRFADAGSWNISLTCDGVHFTEQGHHAFAAGIYEVIMQ